MYTRGVGDKQRNPMMEEIKRAVYLETDLDFSGSLVALAIDYFDSIIYVTYVGNFFSFPSTTVDHQRINNGMLRQMLSLVGRNLND